MKITCDREQLLSAFQTAAMVAPSRSPKPILQNIRLETQDQGAILMATDMEIGIRVQVDGIEIEASSFQPQDDRNDALSESVRIVR